MFFSPRGEAALFDKLKLEQKPQGGRGASQARAPGRACACARSPCTAEQLAWPEWGVRGSEGGRGGDGRADGRGFLLNAMEATGPYRMSLCGVSHTAANTTPCRGGPMTLPWNPAGDRRTQWE